MKQQLSNYLNRYVSFTETEVDLFYTYLTVKTFKKKEHLLKDGQHCREKFFITEGLVRSYKIDSKGQEKIAHFGIENWWITNMESFVIDKPSLFYIQALEPTTVLAISKSKLEMAFEKIPKLERLFRIITENMFVAIERKNELYMKYSSKDRYYNLVDHIPDFAQRVPQYMIASYLDISPEYLSEIRKNK